jgi:hypothetical protein
MPSTENLADWASILGLATSFGAWVDARLIARRQKKHSIADLTLKDYLEWLRRKDHKELLGQLKGSQDALDGIDRAIRRLKSESEESQHTIVHELHDGHSHILASLAALETSVRRLEEAIHLFKKPQGLAQGDRDFESQYIKQVQARFGTIRLFGVPEMRDIRQDLSIAYVSLRLNKSSTAA